ncbi:MAG: helix-turn-helix transcriptional regulator [Planctomycetota bacterium]|nr:helix-turn-helix transcriptional regulator [Planctomycetota bacterium]
MAAARPDLSRQVSEAQRRVLELLLEGKTEPQIAEVLGRSRHTVHDHTKAIYSALKVKNRVQLVLLFAGSPQTARSNAN